MRCIALASTLLITTSVALADEAPKVDLDRPGVLSQLRLEHPKQYQAVHAVLRASERAPCRDGDAKLLKARFDVRDLECGMLISTSYPALRHVSFELDGVRYVATVKLRYNAPAHPLSTSD